EGWFFASGCLVQSMIGVHDAYMPVRDARLGLAGSARRGLRRLFSNELQRERRAGSDVTRDDLRSFLRSLLRRFLCAGCTHDPAGFCTYDPRFLPPCSPGFLPRHAGARCTNAFVGDGCTHCIHDRRLMTAPVAPMLVDHWCARCTQAESIYVRIATA